jgi:hypothetical protein
MKKQLKVNDENLFLNLLYLCVAEDAEEEEDGEKTKDENEEETKDEEEEEKKADEDEEKPAGKSIVQFNFFSTYI